MTQKLSNAPHSKGVEFYLLERFNIDLVRLTKIQRTSMVHINGITEFNIEVKFDSHGKPLTLTEQQKIARKISRLYRREKYFKEIINRNYDEDDKKALVFESSTKATSFEVDGKLKVKLIDNYSDFTSSNIYFEGNLSNDLEQLIYKGVLTTGEVKTICNTKTHSTTLPILVFFEEFNKNEECHLLKPHSYLFNPIEYINKFGYAGSIKELAKFIFNDERIKNGPIRIKVENLLELNMKKSSYNSPQVFFQDYISFLLNLEGAEEELLDNFHIYVKYFKDKRTETKNLPIREFVELLKTEGIGNKNIDTIDMWIFGLRIQIFKGLVWEEVDRRHRGDLYINNFEIVNNILNNFVNFIPSGEIKSIEVAGIKIKK